MARALSSASARAAARASSYSRCRGRHSSRSPRLAAPLARTRATSAAVAMLTDRAFAAFWIARTSSGVAECAAGSALVAAPRSRNAPSQAHMAVRDFITLYPRRPSGPAEPGLRTDPEGTRKPETPMPSGRAVQSSKWCGCACRAALPWSRSASRTVLRSRAGGASVTRGVLRLLYSVKPSFSFHTFPLFSKRVAASSASLAP